MTNTHLSCTTNQFGEKVIVLDSVEGVTAENVQWFAGTQEGAMEYDLDEDKGFIRIQMPGDHPKLYEIKAFTLVLETAQRALQGQEK